MKEMKDASFRKKFNSEYKEFLLSEIIHSLMDNDNKSVRKLAEEVHLSPTVIQNIRSGKQDDVKLSNFINISHACGYGSVIIPVVICADLEHIILACRMAPAFLTHNEPCLYSLSIIYMARPPPVARLHHSDN